MSAIKSWALWCDHEQCGDADAFTNERGFERLADLRATAFVAGWTRRNGKDFCPDHAAPEGDQT